MTTVTGPRPEADGAKKSRPRRRSPRAYVRSLPGGQLIWRVGVTLVGVAVIVLGVVLLPLPGPGWLIIFGGLGVLGTEYEWARRLLRWTRDRVTAWTRWVGRQPVWARVGLGVVALAVVAAAAWLVWTRSR